MSDIPKSDAKLSWSQAAFLLSLIVAVGSASVAVMDRINVSNGKSSIADQVAYAEMKKDVEYIKAVVTEIKDSMHEHSVRIAQIESSKQELQYRINTLENRRLR